MKQSNQIKSNQIPDDVCAETKIPHSHRRERYLTARGALASRTQEVHVVAAHGCDDSHTVNCG